MISATLPQYTIIENPTGKGMRVFEPHGSAVTLWRCKDPEIIISGPAETGKTRTCLEKLDALMWKYPGIQALIARKTFHSLKTTVLLTYEKKVLGALNKKTGKFDQTKTPVQKLGGERPEGYVYPNGSRIYLGGLDVPDKVLSSEWDVVYINQAEELTLNDWEVLFTRTTGRSGNMPYAQMMADCNPGAPNHWIRLRKSLTFLESRHEDNPTLFDPITKAITTQGIRTLKILDSLTGIRYRRLRLGQWASAEGAVYEDFDRTVHLIDHFDPPKEWIIIRGIDFGFTNPFGCQWWALDGDGRLYLYREIYMSHRIVGLDPEGNDHASLINKYSFGERIVATVADHDAEDRATLRAAGIETDPAMKSVKIGIEAVQRRMRKAGDGKPRIFIMRDSLVEVDPLLKEKKLPLCTEDEIDGYIWLPSTEGKPAKEEVLKKNDHGMDIMRYVVAYVDGIQPVQDLEYQEMITDDYDYQISPI